MFTVARFTQPCLCLSVCLLSASLFVCLFLLDQSLSVSNFLSVHLCVCVCVCLVHFLSCTKESICKGEGGEGVVAELCVLEVCTCFYAPCACQVIRYRDVGDGHAGCPALPRPVQRTGGQVCQRWQDHGETSWMPRQSVS